MSARMVHSNALEAERRMEEIKAKLAAANPQSQLKSGLQQADEMNKAGEPETEAEGRKRRRKNRWGTQDTRVRTDIACQNWGCVLNSID